jgi:DNA-binding response OmpR family regulator
MKKILIVDDDVQITILLKRFLTAEGYEVTGLNISSDAVRVANLIHPDLFILDLMMPDPDGFMLCRMLRADPSFIKTPILIVSALDDSDSRALAFTAKASDYLSKPINLDKLTITIKELLDKADRLIT